MKTIVVDDEPIMLKSFVRQSENIPEIELLGTFQDPEEAERFAQNNRIEMAVLDIEMPGISGLELAKRLRALYPDVIIVFISAYDEYVKESNEIDADYYIMKPYKKDTLQQMAKRMSLIGQRQQKSIYVQMFGRFVVYKDGEPVSLRGKTKEILALVASRHGKEISNKEVYSVVWEGRPYGNIEMKVYYNAVRRLKEILEENGLGDLLISTARGQIFNKDLVDCDYYAWLEGRAGRKSNFEGEFLSEYSWGEAILANIMNYGYTDELNS